jgi:hypothetical protein
LVKNLAGLFLSILIFIGLFNTVFALKPVWAKYYEVEIIPNVEETESHPALPNDYPGGHVKTF